MIMDLHVGDIVRLEDGRYAVITKRNSYQASAHNDRWTDYHTEGVFLNKNFTVNKSGHKFTTTTDDALRWNVTKVGTADVEWKVDVTKIKMDA
jgi:NMD protein affecting ribosome stability and mRNA decay